MERFIQHWKHQAIQFIEDNIHNIIKRKQRDIISEYTANLRCRINPRLIKKGGTLVAIEV